MWTPAQEVALPFEADGACLFLCQLLLLADLGSPVTESGCTSDNGGDREHERCDAAGEGSDIPPMDRGLDGRRRV